MKTSAKQALPEINGASILTREAINFKQGYLLKGGTLHPLIADIIGSKTPVERIFKTAEELAELVVQNRKILFGQNSFIITVPIKKGEKEQSTPHFFMLDFGDFSKPRLYFVDIMLSKPDIFGGVFSRVTKFFLNEKECMETFLKLAQKNLPITNVLRQRVNMDKAGIPAFFQNLVITKPTTLLITDAELNGLSELAQVYPLWRNVKSLVIKKYASNGDMLCTMTPSFAGIHLTTKQRVKAAPVTEEEHLKEVMPEVKEMFNRIKAELMKVNTQLSWNVQKFYIALKSIHKIAVFQFSRKKMTIVVMNPEKDTRANIKHYEVKTLTEKVQKFWNGDCCTIVIDDATHLEEVIKLLKKLVTT